MCVASLIASVGLLRTPATAAEPPPLAEHQIKALYLFNFTKYVDWPGPATATNGTPFIIGILDAPELRGDLQEITRGKRIHGREILVRTVATTQDVKACQLVFIGATDKPRIAALLKATQDLAVLTVGEAGNFLTQGGIINFVRQENKLRVEISLDAARRARLVVSAKLLAVAKAVKGRPEAPIN